jgi:hypothetical protein
MQEEKRNEKKHSLRKSCEPNFLHDYFGSLCRLRAGRKNLIIPGFRISFVPELEAKVWL